MTAIALGVEDELSEVVARKMICDVFGDNTHIQAITVRGGHGEIRRRLRSFDEISRRMPVLVMIDLDNTVCAPSLLTAWQQTSLTRSKFLFRVVVREVEAWLLADRSGISRFMGTRVSEIPSDTEVLPDPKGHLIRLAQRARREVRDEIVPRRNSQSDRGVGYNQALSVFVIEHWNVEEASQHNSSLRRAVTRLHELRQHLN